MTDSAPVTPEDKDIIDYSTLLRRIEKLEHRLVPTEKAVKTILEILSESEEIHEIRTLRSLSNFFTNLAASLQDNLGHAEDLIKAKRYGFTIEVVDGVNREVGEHSVIVKKTETGFDYSLASSPDEVRNVGTEPFTEYFKANDHLFNGQDSIVVDISTLRKNVPEEAMNEQPVQSA